MCRFCDSDDLFGEKYFLDGWWNSSQNAWFFKAEHYDTLVELGARELSCDEHNDNYHLVLLLLSLQASRPTHGF